MWNNTTGCIRKVATVLEVSRGSFSGCQGDWRWNGEVQGKVNAWLECMNETEK